MTAVISTMVFETISIIAVARRILMVISCNCFFYLPFSHNTTFFLVLLLTRFDELHQGLLFILSLYNILLVLIKNS